MISLKNKIAFCDPQMSFDEFESEFDNTVLADIRLNNLYVDLSVLVTGILALLAILSLPLFADANNDIMYVIDSPILRGRNDMVAQYSTWIAWVAQLLITACGFMIICLKTVTIGMTLLYLTHPRFWDLVSDVKNDCVNKRGTGDWIATIGSYILPDVKKYSEYGQLSGMEGDVAADRMYEIGGIATISTYVKKNMIQFVVLITLASVLWSGKLLKLVGALSQGCVAVVDWALAIDYGGKVNDLLEADRDYQFMFDKSTIPGKNKDKLARALYSQVKTAVSDNRTSKFLNSVGGTIYTLLDDKTGALGKATNLASANATHINWDNPTLNYSITWNSEAPAEHLNGIQASTSDTGKGVWIIPMSELWSQSEAGDTTVKQQQLYNNGVIYISFNANQVYNGSDFDTEVKPDSDKKDDTSDKKKK